MTEEGKKSCSSDNVSTGTEAGLPMSCIIGRKNSCRRCWCSWNKYWRTLNIFNLVFGYLFIGGAIFNALERPSELQRIEDAQLAINESIASIVDILTNQTNMTEMEAMNLTERFLQLGAEAAAASESLNFEQNPIWDFNSAVFFCVTVITTIGYGTIAPSTSGGQIFFLFYSVIGIPIALIFLTMVGSIIKSWTNRTMRPIEKRWGPSASRAAGSLGLLLATIIFFMIIPAAIFTAIETWNYRESIYFTVTTLTTVGFGDFVPAAFGVGASSSITILYKFITAVWLWIGLALVAGLISEVQGLLEALGKACYSSKNPCCRRSRCGSCGRECSEACDAQNKGDGTQELESPTSSKEPLENQF